MVAGRPCYRCDKHKPLQDFHKDANGPKGRSYYCKGCRRKENFKHRLMHRFGLTVDEYEQMLRDANYSCQVCLRTVLTHGEHEGTKDRACIDHDHETGEVRGILCADCNFAIGFFQDKPIVCLSAAKYLYGRK